MPLEDPQVSEPTRIVLVSEFILRCLFLSPYCGRLFKGRTPTGELSLASANQCSSPLPQETTEISPSQSWKTFLRNHLGEIVAIDFLTVQTIHLRVLFVFLVIEHQRRKVLHFGVTEHPTAEWASQQVVEAFLEQDAKRDLIRDRDSIYDRDFRSRVQMLGLSEVVTAAVS